MMILFANDLLTRTIVHKRYLLIIALCHYCFSNWTAKDIYIEIQNLLGMYFFEYFVRHIYFRQIKVQEVIPFPYSLDYKVLVGIKKLYMLTNCLSSLNI